MKEVCAIGDNRIVNTGAIVDHDCLIGGHVHVAPGAMAHIGTAAAIIQGIKIGAGVIIGAGSVVIRDVPPEKKAVGNPARILE
jgi:UDP-perosamine 4-acetyltransferase